MAYRRARNGTRIRVQQNLSGTLVSIAREMQSARDRNIMSSWQNGGLFEGKKATDDMVLAYWNERSKNLDKGDPTYDAAQQQIEQLRYGIAQSKMEVLYKQNKVSDAQFAKFYLDWAKKIPQNSEFYRTLQKNAAQFTEASRARGRASAAQAKADAFSSYADGISKSYLGLADTLTSVFTQIARDNNLIGADEDLQKFMLNGEDDPGRMEGLLSQINADMRANPAKYKALTDQIRSLDPNFTGQLTSSYFAKALKRAGEGYAKIATRAQKDGYKSWVNWAKKGQDQTHALGIEAKAWPTGDAYADARKSFDAVMNSPLATEADKLDAAQSLAFKIDQMAKNPELDPASRNRLINDAKALRGDPTAQPQDSFGENFLGLKDRSPGQVSPSGDGKGEVLKWQKEMGEAAFYAQVMRENPGQFVYASAKPDSVPPAFDPSGKGPVKVVSMQSVNQDPQAVAIVPVTTVTGQTIMQAVNMHDVFVDDGNGKRKPEPVGKAITIGNLSLYQTADGKWSPVSPYQGSETRDASGDVHLTLPPVRVDNAAAVQASNLPAELKTRILEDLNRGTLPDGSQWDTVIPGDHSRTNLTITLKNGVLVSSGSTDTYGPGVNKSANGPRTGGSVIGEQPLAAVPSDKDRAFDQARIQAGTNPVIDFDTPAMAAIVSLNLSNDDVHRLWANPQFQEQLKMQEQAAAGGDPGRYAKIAEQDANIARDAAAHGAYSVNDAYRQKAEASQRRDLIYPTTQNDPMTQGKLRIAEKLVIPAIADAVRGSLSFGVQPTIDPKDRFAPAGTATPMGAQPGTPVPMTVAPLPTATPTPVTPATPTPATTVAAPPTPATPTTTPVPTVTARPGYVEKPNL